MPAIVCNVCLGRGYLVCAPGPDGYPEIERCGLPHNGCRCLGSPDALWYDAAGLLTDCPVCSRFKGRMAIVRDALRKSGIPRQYRASRIAGLAGDERRDIASRIVRRATEIYALPIADRERLPGAIFTGAPGTGKTESACAILLELILARGRGGLFVSVDDLFARLRSNMDAAPESKRPESEITGPLSWMPTLVLDDLGLKSPLSPFEERILYTALNARWLRRTELLTIVTTNAPEKALAGIAGGRLFSRLADMCAVIQFTGPDHRLARAVGRATVEG
jgi:hypothetical protein